MGQIWQKWGKLGYERFFGYPTTGEVVAADGVGRYTHFSGNGSIYWSPSTTAFELHGSIRDHYKAIGWEVKGMIRLRWRDLGWETSYLGFPTSGEYNTPTGKRSDFQFGYITYNSSTGAIEDRRY